MTLHLTSASCKRTLAGERRVVGAGKEVLTVFTLHTPVCQYLSPLPAVPSHQTVTQLLPDVLLRTDHVTRHAPEQDGTFRDVSLAREGGAGPRGTRVRHVTGSDFYLETVSTGTVVRDTLMDLLPASQFVFAVNCTGNRPRRVSLEILLQEEESSDQTYLNFLIKVSGVKRNQDKKDQTPVFQSVQSVFANLIATLSKGIYLT